MTFNLTELREMREKYGLTQYDICIYIGVSDVAYRTWEMRVRRPREEHLRKLSEIFSILKDNEEAIGNRSVAIETLNELLIAE